MKKGRFGFVMAILGIIFGVFEIFDGVSGIKKCVDKNKEKTED